RRSKQPDRISLIIADNVAQRMNNPLNAIRPMHSVMKTVGLLRLERSFDSTDHPLPIVRMNEFERLLAEVKFLWLKPEDAIELVGPGYCARFYIPVPTANTGQALSFGQLTLATLERFLRAFLFGDVVQNTGGAINAMGAFDREQRYGDLALAFLEKNIRHLVGDDFALETFL